MTLKDIKEFIAINALFGPFFVMIVWGVLF